MPTVILKINAKPNSKTTSFTVNNDEITALIAAQPVDGEANKVLIKALSKTLKVKQQNIDIKAGLNSRHKLIRVYSNYSKTEILELLLK